MLTLHPLRGPGSRPRGPAQPFHVKRRQIGLSTKCSVAPNRATPVPSYRRSVWSASLGRQSCALLRTSVAFRPTGGHSVTGDNLYRNNRVPPWGKSQFPNPSGPCARLGQRRAGGLDLGRSTGSLHRQQHPSGLGTSAAPSVPSDPTGPRLGRSRRRNRRRCGPRLGRARRGHSAAPTLRRLRPGKWYAAAAAPAVSGPGPARARAKTTPGSPAPDPRSQTSSVAVERGRNLCAVQKMPLPESRNLPWPDQPPDDAGLRQQVGVPLQLRPCIAKRRRHPGGWRRRFT